MASPTPVNWRVVLRTTGGSVSSISTRPSSGVRSGAIMALHSLVMGSQAGLESPQSKLTLQLQSGNAVELGRHQTDYLEPYDQRQLGSMDERSCGG